MENKHRTSGRSFVGLKLLLLLFFQQCFALTNAQKLPDFWDEIKAFKKEDSLAFPGRNKILFAGSSSFRMWTDIQKYFPGYPIINRGFGGSTLTDMIRYVPDIIYPYHPKQLFIYCGENDLSSSDTVTVSIVVDRFKNLFGHVRKKYPKLPVLFVSIKPSPSRRRFLSKMKQANLAIKKFLKTKSRTGYVNVYDKMINKHGVLLLDIWKEDSLHMNAKGYAIWQKAIKPHLLK